MHLPPFTVTLEEHATFPSLGDESPFYSEIWRTFPAQRAALRDLDEGRLADMTTGHVTRQILSQLPGTSSTDVSGCHAANNELAAAISKHPNRVSGFATLPMAHPNEAASELERCVNELGIVGAMTDNHLPDGTHYDDKRFWPVFEVAQRLDVPIYIHPAPATEYDMSHRFAGSFSKVVSMGISTGAWGWHEEVGLHVIKLFAAGVFREYPRLNIIVGHMGEMLPLMIDRMDRLKFFGHGYGDVGKFSEVWEKNIWVTSSGIFSVRTLQMLLKVTKIEKVMYSVDSPFERRETGWKFLQDIAENGILT